ncbi:hypothetical protein HDV05_004640 [Chytridiales sp. JEL 0842]|nr:hypothetical protein HDV05_004640 [Chytridiales sp. JEL 0842]
MSARPQAPSMSGLSTSSYRENLQTCVSGYVKRVIFDPSRRAEIKESLRRGVADVKTGMAVTAMVDISGYSLLTSQLSTIGKMGSEVITKTVSEYLDQVIMAISSFRGDVVKFLGDAILVCFHKDDNETDQQTKERAFMCCLYITTNLGRLTINLELAIQENNRFTDEHSAYSSGLQSKSGNFTDSKIVNLFIHVALVAGEVQHVIIGDQEIRMDYCISGPCLKVLGDVLDETKSGELGMTAELYTQIISRNSYSSMECRKVDDSAILTEQAVKMIYDSMEPQILANLSDNRDDGESPGDVCEINSSSTDEQEADSDAMGMLELFVNQALLRKLRFGKELHRNSSIVVPAHATHTHQSRRLSKSSSHGATTVKVNSEFRVVSVIFVKLLSTFEAQKAQIVLSAFVTILKRWEGFFQQYSVDDKGQTLLACFGLPPWTHEKDPLNALKAALDFEEFCTKNSKAVGKVTVAVATGELLFSLLGSGERRDASLLGDVVNLAARIMSLPTPNAIVKCDKSTFAATKQDMHFTSLGLHKVKGKIEPVEVWGVGTKEKKKGEASIIGKGVDIMFGYLKEKIFLRGALEQWRSGVSQRVVIEGPSGDASSSSLLSEVLPFLKTSSDETDAMDAATRCFLVKNLVARMVKASSRMEKYVIVLDDGQWVDAISLDIIQAMLKSCPQLMIVIFTRPISDTQGPVLKSVIQFPEVDHVVLNGLSLEDVETLLKQKFDEYEIKSVSKSVCKVILEKSNKLPLYIDMIAESLKDDFYNKFEIDMGGELVFKESDAESRIGALENLNSSLMTTFDRLNPSIQSVLLKASILGQYFSLQDLAFFLNTTVPDLEKIIQDHDTHHYLVPQDSDANPEAADTHLYMFRHVHLLQAFYNSQSFAERSAVHLQAAIYFENALDGCIDRDNLLTLVVHHYRKTAEVGKQVAYLEELGVRTFHKGHVIESAGHLEVLTELVSQHSEDLKVGGGGVDEQQRKAHWLAMLAVQKVSVAVYTIEQYERVVLALNLVGVDWPGKPNQVGKAVLRAARALYKLWKATKGGSCRLPESTDCFGRKKELRYYRIPPNETVAETMLLSFRTIFRMGIYSTYIDSKLKLLVMLSQCCLIILDGYRNKGKWAGTLYWASFGLSWSLVPISRVYWQQAEKIEKTIDKDADREDLHGYYQYKGYNLFQAAKFSEALNALSIALRYFNKRGDMSNKMGVLGGDITTHEDHLLELSKEKDTFQVVHLIFLTNRKMMTVDSKESKSRHQRTMDVNKAYPPNIIMDGVMSVNEAWLAFQEGNVARALDVFEVACKNLNHLRHSVSAGYSAIVFLGMLSWMLSQPCVVVPFVNIERGGEEEESKHRLLDADDRQRLLVSLDVIMQTTTFFAVKNKMRILWVAHIMLKANKFFLLNKKKKAMGILLAELKSPRSIEILNEMKASKAFVYSVLGLHLDNSVDRQHYIREAVGMYQEFGFTYMEKWLVWNDEPGVDSTVLQ